MVKVQRRQVPREVDDKVLKADLESYKEKALTLGANAAEVIPASYVQVDERVRLKCLVPRCFYAGTSPHCPPHTPEPEFMRQALSKYSWAVLYKVDIQPLEEYIPAKRGAPTRNPDKTWSYHDKISEITGTIEGMAFREGYHLAMGFSGGSCKATFCRGMFCRVLDSGICPNFLRARPSMEGVGIDVISLALKLGWDVYPVCYVETDPASIPRAVSIGIVLVH